MALVKCKECGKEISNTAKTCPNCGAVQKKSGFGCLTIILIIVALGVLLAVFASLFSSKPPAANNGPSNATKLKTALTYLTEKVPEIDWVEFQDNDVYIGFNKRPDDLDAVLAAAALNGNRAINFGVHVWAVDSKQKHWRPGKGPYWKEVTD